MNELKYYFIPKTERDLFIFFDFAIRHGYTTKVYSTNNEEVRDNSNLMRRYIIFGQTLLFLHKIVSGYSEINGRIVDGYPLPIKDNKIKLEKDGYEEFKIKPKYISKRFNSKDKKLWPIK